MFFTNYPQTVYKFGTEKTNSAFQNISVYVDLIDQVKDNINFYQYYYIQDGYRPDTVSYQLYGSIKQYWTLYFLNDNLREFGWPLSAQEIRLKAIEDYPNIVLTTRDIDTLFTHFQIGELITGQSSGATGTIVKRNLELGQLFISLSAGSQTFLSAELIRDNINPEFPQTVEVVGSAIGYNAIHHYEDESGVYTDIDPYSTPSVLLTPITYLDRYQAQNDLLRSIKILKPGAIDQVYKSYQDALRSV
tara:strand:- start:26380 stop:27120 length:741 start_codon:yes stop_codon:yes gene_type:complete